MKYKNIVEGVFLERPNRFIAMVKIDNEIHRVHVKNTGRCKELLIPGVTVYLEYSPSPNRKTQYSLITVLKGDLLINIDSQVPNKVVYDSLLEKKIYELGSVEELKREKTYKSSRFDMYFEKDEKKGFIEVKGVTLERDGIAMFPDAPTERGRKHVLEMIDAVSEGYLGVIILLVQIDGIKSFTPNYETDPEFGRLLKLASDSGVMVLCYNSKVQFDGIEIGDRVEVRYSGSKLHSS